MSSRTPTESLWPSLSAMRGMERWLRKLDSATAKKPLWLDQIAAPAQPFWLGFLLESLSAPRDCWIVCRDVAQQERMANELAVWWAGQALFFPRHEALQFEGALPDPETASERLHVLHEIAQPAERVRAVLLHHESLEETVPAPGSLERVERKIEAGSRWDLAKLTEELAEAGFERVPQVYERGQFAQRGGILDVFAWQAAEPVRLEFFDDEVESIRVFDLNTQGSIERRQRASLLLKDAGESFGQLQDYVKLGDFVFSLDCPEDVASLAAVRITEVAVDHEAAPAWASFDGPLGEFHAGDFVLQEARRKHVAEQFGQWAKEGWRVRMYFNNQGEIDRFRELMDATLLESAHLEFAIGRLTRGFTVPAAKLAILCDAELLGRYQHGRAQRLFQCVARQRRAIGENDFKELEPEDLVVHADYGIGRFLGIGKSTSGEDALMIEYDEEAKLFVPLDQAHLVSRYVGVGKASPPLSKLGSGRWLTTRKSAERAIMEYAGELLKVQAQRQTHQGYAHGPDTKWQCEFEQAFLYKETADQLRAIAEAKHDMESTLPMDRLICGDVGFGKTEVAIRAAFKAVMSGTQVAVLAPTTVLAQQHYQTFRERMSDYPVRIECLTRLKKAAEQKAITSALAEGAVDIVIGTHRLISKDVTFKNLGLAVVDEEQRFGVKHKERFKQMFHLVDVLTLSATPIPRTLYLSLMGVKDMSVIETPPPNRLPVQTTICAYDERVIRETIQRERKRDGQVYYLHNRVEDIEDVAARIKRLCPGARVGVGHGQMEAELLEDVMQRFIDAEIDVLVCTTIIESGIDIPNANTIIIDRADRFGLADLYQLRGRVGRAQKKAYAILMLPRSLLTTTDAKKRISAIREYNSLGAGFKIAMRDLEIRGAGNLLGTQQSGHIVAIGFDLYCQLLKQSVSQLQGQKVESRIDVPVRVDFLATSESAYLRSGGTEVPAFIPASYMEEPRLRILAYREVAEAATAKQLKALANHWRDQFGPIPEPAENFLNYAHLKVAAAHANISSVEIKEGKLMLMRRGQYLIINGKFPRLESENDQAKLPEAVEMVRTLRATGQS